MKNKTGMLFGFATGTVGFLLLFKVLVLDHTPPEDELAPGIVVVTALLSGTGCAFFGSWLQHSFKRQKNTTH